MTSFIMNTEKLDLSVEPFLPQRRLTVVKVYRCAKASFQVCRRGRLRASLLKFGWFVTTVTHRDNGCSNLLSNFPIVDSHASATSTWKARSSLTGRGGGGGE